MLALLLLISLGQCTKDTDCKGDRICTAGECVAPPGENAPQPDAAVSVSQPATNPYRLHRIIGMSASLFTWGATVVAAIGLSGGRFDGYSLLACIPVVGPALLLITVEADPNLEWTALGGPLLLGISTALQAGAATYLLLATLFEASWQPRVAVLPGPGLGLSIGARW